MQPKYSRVRLCAVQTAELSRDLLGPLPVLGTCSEPSLSEPARNPRSGAPHRAELALRARAPQARSLPPPIPLNNLSVSLSWNVLSAPSSDHPLSLLRPSSATTLLPTSSDPPPDPPPTLRRGPPRSATATSAVVGGSTAAADLPFALSSSRFGTGLGGRKHCGGRPAVCRRVERRRGALPLQCRRAGAVPRSRQTSYP